MYVVLCAVTQVHASPYPLGSMSCDDIGTFATQAMQWREDGVQYKEAKTRLDALRPDESVEKKNMRVVMQLVFWKLRRQLDRGKRGFNHENGL